MRESTYSWCIAKKAKTIGSFVKHFRIIARVRKLQNFYWSLPISFRIVMIFISTVLISPMTMNYSETSNSLSEKILKCPYVTL